MAKGNMLMFVDVNVYRVIENVIKAIEMRRETNSDPKKNGQNFIWPKIDEIVVLRSFIFSH